MDGASHCRAPERARRASMLAALLVVHGAWAQDAAAPTGAMPDAATDPVPAGAIQDAAADATTAQPAGPPVPAKEPPPDAPVEYQCNEPGSDQSALVDRVQRGVYVSVCGTARWFDGLFGTRRFDQDSDETFGRLGIGEFWDDRDGFDEKIKLRVRVALPTAERRLKLLFGRVDEQEVDGDSQSQAGTSLPSSFGGVQDESWLLGLGYSKQGELSNGFDFGAGVRLRTPVDPYTKGTYRHTFVFGDDIALRARQTVFWRDSRGWGETTELTFDKLLTDRLLLRWDNGATLAEDVERLEWYSGVTAFQSLGNRSGLAYTTFVNGVVNTDVPVRNYGLELRFRRSVLRRWLFLELRSSLTWPKELPDEERDINPGAGIGFEMYFGPVPELQMR